MILIDYLHQLPSGQRAPFAQSCGTSLGHLRNVAYGYRPCAAALAVRIERATAGQVTRPELCPQDWQDIWPELADSQPNPPSALVEQGQDAIGSEQQEASHG